MDHGSVSRSLRNFGSYATQVFVPASRRQEQAHEGMSIV